VISSGMQIRRPLVGMALAVATGLYLQNALTLSPLLLLSIAAGILAWACLRLTRHRSGALIYVCCGVLAAAHLAASQSPSLVKSALFTADNLPQGCEIAGTVMDEPVQHTGAKTPYIVFRFKTEAVCSEDGWHSDTTVLRIYMYQAKTPVAYGERWRLHGRYTGYEAPRNGAAGTFRVGSDNTAVRLGSARPSLPGRCYQIRRQAAGLLQHGLEKFPEHVQLLKALLLGYRQAMPLSLYRTFACTGTLHIFAISGLHVGVMAAILIAILKMTGLSRPRWGLVLIPALFLYVFSTGMKPSALRAFTMASIYFAAPLAGRRPDPVSSIALAAILLLAVNPLQITNPGFVLSFTVVSGIVLVHGFASRQLHGFRRPGWTVPLASLAGRHPLMGLLRCAGLLAVTSLAAWLFSAPLTARYFNTFSLVALAGNMVIIPLTFLIVLTGCLTLLSGAVFLPAAVVFNHANHLFITGLLFTVRHAAGWPGAYRFIRSPSAVVLLLWYSGWVLFFAGSRRMRTLALSAVLASGLLWGVQTLSPPSGTIVFGSSSEDAICLRLPGPRYVLAERGSSFSAARTRADLQRAGINRLHALVITDRRADAAAVRMLTEMFEVDRLWLSQADFRDDLAAEAVARGIPVYMSDQPNWPVEAGRLEIRLRENVTEHPQAIRWQSPVDPPAS